MDVLVKHQNQPEQGKIHSNLCCLCLERSYQNTARCCTAITGNNQRKNCNTDNTYTTTQKSRDRTIYPKLHARECCYHYCSNQLPVYGDPYRPALYPRHKHQEGFRSVKTAGNTTGLPRQMVQIHRTIQPALEAPGVNRKNTRFSKGRDFNLTGCASQWGHAARTA